ncbi:putative polyamine aminopropyl transferase [Heracleum sosnowskyi]|uniref:Polyamine aminopropyl transferase n=1 Tax=Heracleum sosnowskyi TaxID=360622 RepID=A0AAD8H296_9APIA|nr:putative polyamine aminopropyl transferase [Heracleum sosnowskyi]
MSTTLTLSTTLNCIHTPLQTQLSPSHSFQIPQLSHSSTPPYLNLRHSLKPRLTLKAQQTQKPDREIKPQDGIPIEYVKTLASFKSRYNYIRVIEVSRRSDHPFAGSRLLLLDGPGNIHSISYLFKSLTSTYFDVFAILPPILPPGPLGILGFGAGSAARLILEVYPSGVIHGFEIDPDVISVGREYFGLAKMEKKFDDRLFVYVGDALNARVENGYSGFLVDLFGKGCLIPELQDPGTWEMLKKRLRKGGKIMVNVGGRCVEPEDSRRDGRVIMEETLKAMYEVFPGEVYVMSLGNGKNDDSSIAFVGEMPNLELWRKALPKSLKLYVDMWKPYC